MDERVNKPHSVGTYEWKKDTTTGAYVRKQPKLLPSDKHRPPRAQFFGKMGGKPVESLGDLEERFLTVFEFTHWLKQKERSDASKAGILDVTDDKLK